MDKLRRHQGPVQYLEEEEEGSSQLCLFILSVTGHNQQMNKL
jgi:hypothetical protein